MGDQAGPDGSGVPPGAFLGTATHALCSVTASYH